MTSRAIRSTALTVPATRNIRLLLFQRMRRSRPIARRQPKVEKPLKLVVYLSDDENRVVEQAAATLGRSKSAFGAEVILREAKRIIAGNSTP